MAALIWVQVVWNAQKQSCEILVGTTYMRVRGAQNEKVTIKWLLPDASNFEFRMEPPTPPPVFATPIIFKKPEQGAGTQFSNLKVTPKKVELDDSRSAKGPYDHGVRVYNKRTGEKLESDPSIYNDGSRPLLLARGRRSGRPRHRRRDRLGGS